MPCGGIGCPSLSQRAGVLAVVQPIGKIRRIAATGTKLGILSLPALHDLHRTARQVVRLLSAWFLAQCLFSGFQDSLIRLPQVDSFTSSRLTVKAGGGAVSIL